MHVFEIAPAGARPLWVLLPVTVTLVGVLVIVALTVLGSQRSRFVVSPDGLRIRGDLYGRFIPAHDLVPSQARRARVDGASELRPRRRTVGSALPGYRSGWFRLANGERALVYVTDASKVVYVPTALGYSLLLSPDAPDAFLASLQALPQSR